MGTELSQAIGAVIFARGAGYAMVARSCSKLIKDLSVSSGRVNARRVWLFAATDAVAAALRWFGGAGQTP
jgi:hypothetical protein